MIVLSAEYRLGLRWLAACRLPEDESQEGVLRAMAELVRILVDKVGADRDLVKTEARRSREITCDGCGSPGADFIDRKASLCAECNAFVRDLDNFKETS